MNPDYKFNGLGILETLLFLSFLSLTQTSKSDFYGSQDRTIFACDGSPLVLSCEEGGVIQITRANYGRFSIAICNEEGRTDWSVNCFAPKSGHVLSESCNGLRECRVNAEDFNFGSNPCPETRRYLEAHYNCVPASKNALPPWLSANADGSGSGNRGKPMRRVPITAAPTTTTTTTTTSTTTTATTSEERPAHTSNKTPEDSESDSSIATTFRSVSAAPIFYVESSSSSPSSSFSQREFCSERIQRGLIWPETRSGTVAALRCPNNPVRTARWACQPGGSRLADWPDLSDCESQWLTSLKDSYKNTRDGDLTLKELFGRLRSSTPFGGDIIGTIELVRSVLSATKRASFLHAEVILEILGSLLNPEFNNSWKDLTESKAKYYADKLITLTEDLGGSLANNAELYTPNIKLYVKRREGGSLGDEGEYLYMNETLKNVGILPNDILARKNSRILVLSVFENLDFFQRATSSSKMKSLSLYESAQKVNYEGARARIVFEDVYLGECESWEEGSSRKGGNWIQDSCVKSEDERGTICVCDGLGRFAIFYDDDSNLPNSEKTEETLGGLSRVTFIIVIVVTSILTVVFLLSFTLIIIYCRRVKIQDKWDRSWYCRKRETDLSDTNTTSTTAMALNGTRDGYAHPLFGGEIGHLINSNHPSSATTRKSHKGGYQELCINPQYGSQTLVGSRSRHDNVEWTSLTNNNFRRPEPSQSTSNTKRFKNDELLFCVPPPSRPRKVGRGTVPHLPSSASSSSGGGSQSRHTTQHIYMEVDPRYDVDSGFTEETYDHRRHRRLLPNAGSDEIFGSEEIPSSPRESSSRSSVSEGELEDEEEDFDKRIPPSSSNRRLVKPRSNDAYLLSWQQNNKKPRGFKTDRYVQEEGNLDERDVFTITGRRKH